MHFKNLVLDLTFVSYGDILRSSITPLTPLFFGPAMPDSICKWRGIFSDVSYNSYLRNAYVKLNSGLKREAGTPLIEFSKWNTTSTIKLVLPKTLTYKVFKFGNSWKFGSLGRLSTVLGERWSFTLGFSDSNFLSFLLPTTNLFASAYEPLGRRAMYNLLLRFNQLTWAAAAYTPTRAYVNASLDFSIFAVVQRNKAVQFFSERARSQAALFCYTQFLLLDAGRKKFYFSVIFKAEIPLFLDSLFLNLVSRSAEVTFSVSSNNWAYVNFNKSSTFNYTRSSFIFLVYVLLHLFLEQRRCSNLRAYFQLVLTFTVNYFINACFAGSVLSLPSFSRSQLLSNISIWATVTSFIQIESQLAVARFTALSLVKHSTFFLMSFVSRYFGFLIPKVTLSLFTFLQPFNSLMPSVFFYTNYKIATKISPLAYNNLTGLFSLKTVNNSFGSSIFLYEYMKVRNFRKKFYRKRKLKKYRSLLISQVTNLVRKKKARRVFFRKFKFGILRAQFSFLFFWSFNFFNLVLFKRSSAGFSLLAFSISSFFILFKRFVRFYGFIFGLFKSFSLNPLVSVRVSSVFQLKFYLWRLFFYFRLLLASFRKFIFKLVRVTENRLNTVRGSFNITQNFVINVGSLLRSVTLFGQLTMLPRINLLSSSQTSFFSNFMLVVPVDSRRLFLKKSNSRYTLKYNKNFSRFRPHSWRNFKRFLIWRVSKVLSKQHLFKVLFQKNWAAGFRGKRLLVVTILSTLDFFKTFGSGLQTICTLNSNINFTARRFCTLKKRILKKSFFSGVSSYGKGAVNNVSKKLARYIRFLLNLRKNYFVLVNRQFLFAFSSLLQSALSFKKPPFFYNLSCTSSSAFFWKFKFFTSMFSYFSMSNSLVSKHILALLVEKIFKIYSHLSHYSSTPFLSVVSAFINKNMQWFLPILVEQPPHFSLKINLKKFVKKSLQPGLALESKAVLNYKRILRQFSVYSLKLVFFSRFFSLRLLPILRLLRTSNFINKTSARTLLLLADTFFYLLKKFSLSRSFIKRSELTLSFSRPVLKQPNVGFRLSNFWNGNRKTTTPHSNTLNFRRAPTSRVSAKLAARSLTYRSQFFVGRHFLKRMVRIFNKLRHRKTYLMRIACGGRVSDISAFSDARKLVIFLGSNIFLSSRQGHKESNRLLLGSPSFINSRISELVDLGRENAFVSKYGRLNRKLLYVNKDLSFNISRSNSDLRFQNASSCLSSLTNPIVKNTGFFFASKRYPKLFGARRKTVTYPHLSLKHPWLSSLRNKRVFIGDAFASTAESNWTFLAHAGRIASGCSSNFVNLANSSNFSVIPYTFFSSVRWSAALPLKSQFFLRLRKPQHKTIRALLSAENFFVINQANCSSTLDRRLLPKKPIFNFKFCVDSCRAYFSIKGKPYYNNFLIQSDLSNSKKSFSSRKLNVVLNNRLTVFSSFLKSISRIRLILNSSVTSDLAFSQTTTDLYYLDLVSRRRSRNLSGLLDYYISIFCLLPTVISSKFLPSLKIFQGLLLKRCYVGAQNLMFAAGRLAEAGLTPLKQPCIEYPSFYFGLQSTFFGKFVILFRRFTSMESTHLLIKTKRFFSNFLTVSAFTPKNSFTLSAFHIAPFSFPPFCAVTSSCMGTFSTNKASSVAPWCILWGAFYVKSVILSVYYACIPNVIPKFFSKFKFPTGSRGLFGSVLQVGVFHNFSNKADLIRGNKSICSFTSALSVLMNKLLYFSMFKSFDKAGLHYTGHFLLKCVSLLSNFLRQGFRKASGSLVCSARFSFLFSNIFALKKFLNRRWHLSIRMRMRHPVEVFNYKESAIVDHSKVSLYCKAFADFYFSLKQPMTCFFSSFLNTTNSSLLSFALRELTFNKHSTLFRNVFCEISGAIFGLNFISNFSFFARQTLLTRFFFIRSLFFGKVSSYIRLSLNFLTYSVINCKVRALHLVGKALFKFICLPLLNLNKALPTKVIDYFTNRFKLYVRLLVLNSRFALDSKPLFVSKKAVTLVKANLICKAYFKVPISFLKRIKSLYGSVCAFKFGQFGDIICFSRQLSYIFFSLRNYVSFGNNCTAKAFLWDFYPRKSNFFGTLILFFTLWKGSFFFRFNSSRGGGLLRKSSVFIAKSLLRASALYPFTLFLRYPVLNNHVYMFGTSMEFNKRLSSIFNLLTPKLHLSAVDRSLTRSLLAKNLRMQNCRYLKTYCFTACASQVIQYNFSDSSVVFYALSFFERVAQLLRHTHILRRNDLFNSSVLNLFYSKLRRTFRLRVYVIVRKLGFIKRRPNRLAWRRLKRLGFIKPSYDIVTSRDRLTTSTYFGKKDFSVPYFKKKGHFFVKNLNYNFVSRRWSYDKFKRVVSIMRVIRRLVFSTRKMILPHFLTRKRRLRKAFKRRQYKFWARVILLKRYLTNFNYLNFSVDLRQRAKLNRNFLLRFGNSVDLSSKDLPFSTNFGANVLLTLYLFRKRLISVILGKFIISAQSRRIYFFRRSKFLFLFYFMLYLFNSSHSFFFSYCIVTSTLLHVLSFANNNVTLIRLACLKQFFVYSYNICDLRLLTCVVDFSAFKSICNNSEHMLSFFSLTLRNGFELSWNILFVGGVIFFKHLVVDKFFLSFPVVLLFTKTINSFRYSFKRKLSRLGRFSWRFFLLRCSSDHSFTFLSNPRPVFYISSRPNSKLYNKKYWRGSKSFKIKRTCT